MAKVTFYFPKNTEYAVTVDVEDPKDEDQVEAALEVAYDLLPGGGGPYVADNNWSIDLDTADLEAKYALDASGEVIWGGNEMNEEAILKMIDTMLSVNIDVEGDPENEAYWAGYDDGLRNLKGWIEAGAQL